MKDGSLFLQHSVWASLRAKQGWEPKAFVINIEEKKHQLLILKKKITPFISLSYVGHGPYFINNQEELKELSVLLAPFLKTTFIRYDLLLGITRTLEEEHQKPKPLSFPFYKGEHVNYGSYYEKEKVPLS